MTDERDTSAKKFFDCGYAFAQNDKKRRALVTSFFVSFAA